MPVAAQDDHIGGGVADQIEQLFPLLRQIAPLFPSVVEGEDLDAADQKP